MVEGDSLDGSVPWGLSLPSFLLSSAMGYLEVWWFSFSIPSMSYPIPSKKSTPTFLLVTKNQCLYLHLKEPQVTQQVPVKPLKTGLGTYLVAQWIRLHGPNARGPGLIPGQGTRSHMHAATKSSHATTKEPTSRN